MELKQLRFLTVCAQTGSFSRAAGLLFTTQSNVSKVIKSLEEELGMELFERRQYGITLTEPGQRVYEYARAALDNARKISDFSRQRNVSELRICCNPSSWMAACFRDYFLRHGRADVHYSVITAGTNDLIRRLAGEVDQLGFLYTDSDRLPTLKDSLSRSHLRFKSLLQTDAVLYFGNRDAALGYSPDREAALVQGFEDEFSLQTCRNGSEPDLPPYRIAVTTNSDYVMRELLIHTHLGNISGRYLSGAAAAGTPRAVPLSREQGRILFGCVFRDDRPLGALPLEYLSFVTERLDSDKILTKK